MSDLHDVLWTVCRKLSSDFTPYGERDRDTDTPWQDCSCGCKHFVPLADNLGHDWGVCANAKSPRSGLLTFEHQGCPEFEAIDETESAEKPAIAGAAAPATPALEKIKIDLEELVLALEGFPSPETEHFLDTQTGEIIPVNENFDDYEEVLERIEAEFGERYRRIDQIDAGESFRVMENFVVSLPDSRLKTRLVDAIRRNKPFRHFKDIVHSDLALRAQWFAFRDEALSQYARDWLEALGFDAEWLRRPET